MPVMYRNSLGIAYQKGGLFLFVLRVHSGLYGQEGDLITVGIISFVEKIDKGFGFHVDLQLIFLNFYTLYLIPLTLHLQTFRDFMRDKH